MLLQWVCGLRKIGEPWLARKAAKILRRNFGDELQALECKLTKPRLG